jgi:hypothetical protein
MELEKHKHPLESEMFMKMVGYMDVQDKTETRKQQSIRCNFCFLWMRLQD